MDAKKLPARPSVEQFRKDARALLKGRKSTEAVRRIKRFHPRFTRLTKAKIAHWEEEHGDRRSVYFEDPNGNVLELTAPPSITPAQADPEAAKIVKRWAKDAKS